MNPQSPETYPRRILLCVTGLSPQVVTETLYALAVREAPAFIPTEIHLVTTQQGAEHARLNLLSRDPGWFHRLCRDYNLEGIRFDPENIHTLKAANGQPLDDIRSLADNESAANQITELVRGMTHDAQSALHVSIAGGRKTMGFYLGYALSLFGRSQDRLSHVLVTPPFEAHPLFYYPTPYESVIHTRDHPPLALDCRRAEVMLAEIPFVSLRHGLPEDLLKGVSAYSTVVHAAQSHLGPPRLEIDLTAKTVLAGGKPIALSPVELAWYVWMARRAGMGQEPLTIPTEDNFDTDYARDYLIEYRRIARLQNDEDRTTESLQQGMDKTFFETHKSRINRKLRRALGAFADNYLIQPFGRRPRTRFGLGLDREAMTIKP